MEFKPDGQCQNTFFIEKLVLKDEDLMKKLFENIKKDIIEQISDSGTTTVRPRLVRMTEPKKIRTIARSFSKMTSQ